MTAHIRQLMSASGQRLLGLLDRTWWYMRPIVTGMVAVGLTVGAMVLYWYHKEYVPPFKMINPDQHYAIVRGGDTVVIGRQFAVYKTTTITINRELLTPDGLRIGITSWHHTYPPDEYREEREAHVPSWLKPGTYTLRSWACWEANLIRKEECSPLPELQVEVPER